MKLMKLTLVQRIDLVIKLHLQFFGTILQKLAHAYIQRPMSIC